MRPMLVLAIIIAIVSGTALGQNPSFDRLAPADREALQQRFEKEVWPLLARGGKDGCVGCHGGKLVSALRMSGDPGKDFSFMLKEGFFIPDDAGSVLSRIVDPSPKRRMPPGKRPQWSDAEVQVLRAFVVDLDKKQK
jgi:hypothetical protein